MRYTIYKITNLVNGKYYIGKHQTENPNDRYFGSGIGIKRAIAEYGKNNFRKEVLFDFSSEEEMNCKERELITEEIVADRLSYNLAVGGEGGAHFKGRKHSEETKALLSKQSANRKHSEETLVKLRGKSLSEERKKENSEFAKKRVWSAETKRKISESLRKYREDNPVPNDVRKRISATMKSK